MWTAIPNKYACDTMSSALLTNQLNPQFNIKSDCVTCDLSIGTQDWAPSGRHVHIRGFDLKTHQMVVGGSVECSRCYARHHRGQPPMIQMEVVGNNNNNNPPQGGGVDNQGAHGAQRGADDLVWQQYDPSIYQWVPIPGDLQRTLQETWQSGVIIPTEVRFGNGRVMIDFTGFTLALPKRQHFHIRLFSYTKSVVVQGGDNVCAICEGSGSDSARYATAIVEWKSFDPRKNVWISYSEEVSAQLEEYFTDRRAAECPLTLFNMQFIVKFFEMIQFSVKNQGHRHVRRCEGGCVTRGDQTTCNECRPQEEGRGRAAPRRGQPQDLARQPGRPQPQDARQAFRDPAKPTHEFDLNVALSASPLFNRRWLQLGAAPAENTFTAMQWNVLFSKFARASKECCPPAFLDPQYRQSLTIRYILHNQPDILTMQELDSPRTALHQSFVEALASKSYQGAVIAKGREGEVTDGSGIFYNTLRFDCEDWLRIKFSASHEAQLATDSRVAIAVRLRCKKTSKRIVVVTTHLAASKLEEDLRVVELSFALQEVERWHGASSPCAFLLTGDFNASPNWAVPKALRQGALNVARLTGSDASLGDLLFSYSDKLFPDRPLTIYMPHTHDALDYMYYSAGVQPTAVSVFPTELDIVRQSSADAPQGVKYHQLPTPSFPSDHLPLIAQFQFL